jgi:hypothetical protein
LFPLHHPSLLLKDDEIDREKEKCQIRCPKNMTKKKIECIREKRPGRMLYDHEETEKASGRKTPAEYYTCKAFQSQVDHLKIIAACGASSHLQNNIEFLI